MTTDSLQVSASQFAAAEKHSVFVDPFRTTTLRASTSIVISGTGHYVPEIVVTNDDLIARTGLPITDAWIQERAGLRERRWAPPEQATSDLAIEAGRRALEAAGVEAKDLGHIILATTTGDWISPSTACVVQNALGARCPAHDIGATCSGFIYAFDQAARMVATGLEPVLVIAANTMSRVLDPTDRKTVVLFGDGAGAAVVRSSTEDRGLVDIQLYADGSGADLISIPAGGSRSPATAETVAARLHTLHMKDGPRVFQAAASGMAELVRRILERNSIQPSDIDWVVPHQANKLIIEKMGVMLGIPKERIVVNFERYGNTSAASVAMGLDELARSGRVRPGDRILAIAVGAGYTGGALLYRW